MEKKINVAELLKDCPQGMELDCAMFIHPVTFDKVINYVNENYPIVIKTHNGSIITFTKYGTYTDAMGDAKCVIYPKGKTTWEGFVPPCQFKDGDVLSYQYKGFENRAIYIYMNHSKMNTTYYVALSGSSDSEFMINNQEGHALNGYNDTVRHATKEEKEKLFKAIKDNGYKWNAETKTLEKLIEPKFKVGDVIQDIDSYKVKITEVNIEDECYGYESMISKGIGGIGFNEQDNWELIPNKFDITTLVPFESKVLVRDDETEKWSPAIWGFYDASTDLPYIVVGVGEFKMGIPYKENEHLLGTKDDCDDFYKTW